MYEDIPEFLRISQADRKEAWLTFKPRIVKEEVKRLPLNLPRQDNQGVAQSGRASHLECDGPTFKSSHPDQVKRGRGRPAKLKVEKPKSTHGNVGKAWMLNRATGERLRTNEVDKYETLGYVKAGPRTK